MIKIIYAFCRDHVIVCMWNFISDKHSTYTSTFCSFLYGRREELCSTKYRRIIGFWNIREMIDFTLRHDERMSRNLRKNIEKCIRILILIELVGRDFSGDDFGKKCGHMYTSFQTHAITCCAIL